MPEIEYKEKISQGWGCWVNIFIENDSWANGSDVKLLAMKRPEFDPWVRKIPWEKEMAIHSSILSWRIPQREEPGRL